jgi:general secretion pathway protein G
MSARTRSDNAFTLVELLIVVAILGILAALVIPQFGNATQTANTSNLQSQLQTIRGQLELFQSQHNGKYPDLSASWDILTMKSNAVEIGPASPTGTAFGTYLPKPPVNPVNGSSAVAASPAAGIGWIYTSTNGAIKACVAAATQATLGLSSNDVATY